MKTITKAILGVFAVIIVVLLAQHAYVHMPEPETVQSGKSEVTIPENGYETASVITREGKVATLYRITSDEYYFQPGSVTYEQFQWYDEIRYRSIGRHITDIDLTNRQYRLLNGIASFDGHEKYWTSKKPIKIDKAITEAERIEKELKDEDLKITFLTKDGETVNYRYTILNPEKYIIPYAAEVYTTMGRQGDVKGIDPDCGGFAGMESQPAYYTRYNHIGIFEIHVYEICQKPIEGCISDVIQNPEKYGYPKEAIGPKYEVLGH